MASAAAPQSVATGKEVQELQAAGYTYVDVRNPEEFATGRVPDSVNIPLGPSLPADFNAKFPKATEKLIVACQAGRRAMTAVAALSSGSIDYQSIVIFSGSMNAWMAEGLPVEK
eukprot:CAMPEP_0119102138 /NCGR_PEP_ID=MMETSP1180-20130426/996_1 /TAXON_ID=3052 ORGANISM="Chlamydomonas cf sp, Strain CCMP681" /NCGR_SAMPLE_ID=MMETSP1180 /ASSEMBLY_ACC=CAM_ASM_000741 /LENGTH=113 /DNA_ID=CAMNT_0007086377 /DNA_START=95 /DNA_END=436 /DNA_ORIENTATION=+